MLLRRLSKLLGLILCLLLSWDISAQPNVNLVDLQLKLQQDVTAVDSALTKTRIANYFIYHDLDSASYYIDDVLAGIVSEEYVLPDTFHKHLLVKAWTHQGQQEYATAKEYIYEAIAINRGNMNRDDKLELLMNLGALLVQTRDTSILDFVEREMVHVDTTLSRADYIMYTLLHKYKSAYYAQKEDYHNAINTLLQVANASFLDKIPNYKYGIRTSLSKYLSFIGDLESADKFCVLALKEDLFKHQKKDLFYDLSILHIHKDSLQEAKVFLDSFRNIRPHIKSDKRKMFYAEATINLHEKNWHQAKSQIDSCFQYQSQIENNQDQLELYLLHSNLCDQMKDTASMVACLAKMDSLMLSDSSLFSITNRANVARIKFLHKLSKTDDALTAQFRNYESNNAALIEKKIDPDLIAAVLAFDKEEQDLQMQKLAANNAAQESLLLYTASNLKNALVALVLLIVLVCYFIRRNIIRGKNEYRVELEKIQLERSAIEEKYQLERKAAQEKRQLANQALNEKNRLRLLAQQERRRLEIQQNELKSRIEHIEKSKTELENKLLNSQEPIDKEYILITTKTKVHKIKIDQLKYVIAESDGTRFHLKENSFWVILSLKEVMELLPAEYFVRIFRSTVVNTRFIMAVNSSYVILENGEELAMSRTYREGVRDRVG